MILFDPDMHQYRLHGQIVPSVTQVLSMLEDYSHIPPHILDRKARLGTAVHKACELLLADDLDEATIHETVWPYLDQFKRWLAISSFEPFLVEERVYSDRYGYAGTLDLYGEYQGKRVLIDIKTAVSIMPSYGPQTAAYRAALAECKGIEAEGRFVLQLTPKNFRFVPQPDNTGDIYDFYAALRVHNWKKKHDKNR